MIIKNVRVVNHDAIIDNADIIIEKGLVIDVIKRPGKSKLTAIPGFIDLHIHGHGGHDVMDSSAAVATISTTLKKVGVAAFAPTVMTNSLDVIKKALHNVARASYPGSKFVGIHLEGPFISLVKKGAHDSQFIIAPTTELITELFEASHRSIRIMTYAPEVWTKKTMQLLPALGIIPSIGHSNATYDEALNAVSLGATQVTHLWNAMSGAENRKPGIVTEALLDDRVYSEMICDFIHIDPATIQMSIKAKGVSRVIAVTDALKASGTPDGYSLSGGLEVEKRGIKITLKGTDTLAGSGATMLDNFHHLVKLGFTLSEAVAMTSTNAAHSLNLKMGEIRPGFPADIVVLDDKLAIDQALVDGQ